VGADANLDLCQEPVKEKIPNNLRQHRQRTERNLVIGGLLILLVVGGGLIWFFNGSGAALLGVVCIGGGIVLLGGVFLVLKLFEILGRLGDDE
jgi:hypothetical protein